VKIVATLPPMHAGEMLREEFLKPMDLTPYKVAKACGVPRTRIEMNLQTRYDIHMAERAIAGDLTAIRKFKREAA